MRARDFLKVVSTYKRSYILGCMFDTRKWPGLQGFAARLRAQQLASGDFKYSCARA